MHNRKKLTLQDKKVFLFVLNYMELFWENLVISSIPIYNCQWVLVLKLVITLLYRS